MGAQCKCIHQGLFYPAAYENEGKQGIFLPGTSISRMAVYFEPKIAI